MRGRESDHVTDRDIERRAAQDGRKLLARADAGQPLAAPEAFIVCALRLPTRADAEGNVTITPAEVLLLREIAYGAMVETAAAQLAAEAATAPAPTDLPTAEQRSGMIVH